jgi:hypothetical protein
MKHHESTSAADDARISNRNKHTKKTPHIPTENVLQFVRLCYLCKNKSAHQASVQNRILSVLQEIPF